MDKKIKIELHEQEYQMIKNALLASILEHQNKGRDMSHDVERNLYDRLVKQVGW